LTFNGLHGHGVISQKTEHFINIAVRVSNPINPNKVSKAIAIKHLLDSDRYEYECMKEMFTCTYFTTESLNNAW
jgi:hypothetical protein